MWCGPPLALRRGGAVRFCLLVVLHQALGAEAAGGARAVVNYFQVCAACCCVVTSLFAGAVFAAYNILLASKADAPDPWEPYADQVGNDNFSYGYPPTSTTTAFGGRRLYGNATSHWPLHPYTTTASAALPAASMAFLANRGDDAPQGYALEDNAPEEEEDARANQLRWRAASPTTTTTTAWAVASTSLTPLREAMWRGANKATTGRPPSARSRRRPDSSAPPGAHISTRVVARRALLRLARAVGFVI